MAERNPLLIGRVKEIDLVRPDVRAMLEREGLYIGGDSRVPRMLVPLVSQGGKVFSMKIDGELPPERFLPTLTLHGPYFATPPQPAPCEVPGGWPDAAAVERAAVALYGLGKNATPFSKTDPQIQEAMRVLARVVLDAATAAEPN